MNKSKKDDNKKNDSFKDLKEIKSQVIVTRGIIVYPNETKKIDVGREKSLKAIHESIKNNDSKLVVLSQINPSIDSPTKNDIYKNGTYCNVKIIETYEDGSLAVLVTGIKRVKVVKLNDDKSSFVCEFSEIKENNVLTKSSETKLDELVNEHIKNIEKSPELFEVFKKALQDKNAKNVVFDIICSVSNLDLKYHQKLIEEPNFKKRLNFFINSTIPTKFKEKLDDDITKKINSNISKQQKEYYLRERVRVIKEELGDITSKEDDVDAIREKIRNNPYPEHIKKRILSELSKLEIVGNSNEYSLTKSYVDWLMSLPYWQKSTDSTSLVEVEKVLDENHYGLEKVKERIVEYLAVRMRSAKAKGSIICLVGPPGVGKTSLAQSIALSLKKKYVKVSLGGLRDESELKGHRKTYVGAMPGRIIKAMKKAEVNNPVFLLDEIDKIGSDHKGDPASAMLDILDPEQNSKFSDNYIEEDYDLSNVLFIATANYEDDIPGPLYDRLEIIRLSSYTENEKFSIAKKYLIKKILNEASINQEDLQFDDESIKYIIRRYTREAGVRELERLIRQIARKFIVRQQKENLKQQVIGVEEIKFYLKKEIYDYTMKDKISIPGVVNGMAYTSSGGDLLPIEVTHSKGKGKIEITGNLKETMKESVNVALGYVKANADKFNIDPEVFSKIDLHVHVPSGGVPKDGPSAGIALTTAIISSLKDHKIPSNVAMTGEITLRGRVLIIGGVKEKTISAFRGGVNKIFMPREDERYIDEVPKEIRDQINITFVDTYEDVYNNLFK